MSNPQTAFQARFGVKPQPDGCSVCPVPPVGTFLAEAVVATAKGARIASGDRPGTTVPTDPTNAILGPFPARTWGATVVLWAHLAGAVAAVLLGWYYHG